METTENDGLGDDELTPKEYLQQVYKLDEEVSSLLNEYEKSEKITLSASKLKQVMADSNKISNPTEDTFFQRIEYSSDLLYKTDCLVNLKIQISNEIDQIQDRILRILLRERYISSKSWKDIAVVLNYDLRHIHRLHKEALEEFEIMFPEKFK